MSDMKTIWQNQPMEENDMIALSEIRARAKRFQSRSHWRNIALYVYSFANIAASVWLIESGRLTAYRYPMVLMVAAHLLVLWQVKARISARPMPQEMAVRTALDHHRQELERQRDALANAWLWYIAPFMPALIWELVIRALAMPNNIPAGANRAIVFYLVFGAIMFWTAVWLAFSRGALKLQLQIERLNVLKAE